MDDGWQNPSLAKDFVFAWSMARPASATGFACPPDRCARPWRRQWSIVRRARARRSTPARLAWRDGPVSRRRDAGTCRSLRRRSSRRQPPRGASRPSRLAFAGIGRPEKFFASLRAAGAVLVARPRVCRPSSLPLGELAALADEGAGKQRDARHDREGHDAARGCGCRAPPHRRHSLRVLQVAARIGWRPPRFANPRAHWP